tara:strand:+ start:90 stop:446 length:357 start_codon:yes stop_codon:yes gene_type:complete
MKLLSCDTCSREVYVPSETPSVVCALCIQKRVLRVEVEIQNKIDALKTPKSNVPVYKRKRWTKTEDRIIFEFVQTHDISQLMEMLPGRTAYAVENRIWTLKMDHVAKQKYVDQMTGGK